MDFVAANGSYWNPAQGKCVSSPTGDLYGYPIYSSNSCFVPEGQSTCKVSMAWKTYDPLYATTSAVTTPNNITVKSSNSSIAFYDLTANEKRNFFLYHNNVLLDQQEFTASCEPGTTWDGGKCVALEVGFSIIKNINGVEKEIATSLGSIPQSGSTNSTSGLRNAESIMSGENIDIEWKLKNTELINTENVQCKVNGVDQPKGITEWRFSFSAQHNTKYSVICNTDGEDDALPVEIIGPAILNVQTYNTTDSFGNACDIYDAGRCEYDSYNDTNHVVMIWETQELDTCYDTSNANTKIYSKVLGNGNKLWAWDGNNNDNISGVNNINCTKQDTDDVKNISFTFDDCRNLESETGQPICSLLTPGQTGAWMMSTYFEGRN